MPLMSMITLGDLSTYYEKHGQGAPLLLIHGLGSSTEDWAPQVTALAGTFTVIAYDVRGHGRTAKPAGTYSVQQYWTPDGEVRVWIDGRLAFERTGVVMRSLPLDQPPPGRMGPVRDLGIAHLWFNWFHGGLTRNSIDRVVFITGLAYGEAYIGPMKI